MVKSGGKARTKTELILEVWERLASESVGATELEEIQRVLGERLGADAVGSPAAIARTLADQGARLRHPEVLECDATWRERQYAAASLGLIWSLASLSEAAASLSALEQRRQSLERQKDSRALRRMFEFVRQSKEDRLLIARSPAVDDQRRYEAREIAQWLSVWLQHPEIFAEWLDLRRRSREFRERFPG